VFVDIGVVDECFGIPQFHRFGGDKWRLDASDITGTGHLCTSLHIPTHIHHNRTTHSSQQIPTQTL
jgi:hypothetical protein